MVKPKVTRTSKKTPAVAARKSKASATPKPRRAAAPKASATQPAKKRNHPPQNRGGRIPHHTQTDGRRSKLKPLTASRAARLPAKFTGHEQGGAHRAAPRR